MKIRLLILLVLVTGSVFVDAQVIDMRLHSYTNKDYFGGQEHRPGITSPGTTAEHLKETIQKMNKAK